MLSEPISRYFLSISIIRKSFTRFMIHKPHILMCRNLICHQLLLRLGFVLFQFVNRISFVFPLDQKAMRVVIDLLLKQYRTDTLLN